MFIQVIKGDHYCLVQTNQKRYAQQSASVCELKHQSEKVLS